MERTSIDDLQAFEALRPRWEALYRADASSQIFLSYRWLRAFLPNAPHSWSIVALREGDELVAAFPVSLRDTPHRRLPIARELTFASAPFADYQGMLCRPGREDEAIAAFAQILTAMRWDRASLMDVRDARVEAVVAKLGTSCFPVRATQGSPCSAIDLPARWDEYLAGLSKSTRRGLTQPLASVAQRLPASRFTLCGDADADLHIDALLRLNKLRWGATPARTARYRGLLRSAFAQGCLRVGVLWDGERAIGAGALFYEDERGYCGLYLLAHDPEYGRHSPGKIVLAALIRDACERGYRVFDFLRGDEEYKTSYATRSSTNVHLTVTRPNARTFMLRAVEPAYASLRPVALRLLVRHTG